MVQLEPSKLGIIDLLKDLLVETNGFKYQITMKLLLRKYKENGGIKFDSIHFNSTTKTVINSEYGLDKYFQEILYRIDNWINDGSDLVMSMWIKNMWLFLSLVYYKEAHTLNCLIN